MSTSKEVAIEAKNHSIKNDDKEHTHDNDDVDDDDELRATKNMCYACMDILMEELWSRSQQKTNGNNNKRQQSRNGGTANTNNYSDHPALALVLEDLGPMGASIECPLFVTWEKKSQQQPSFYTSATTTTTMKRSWNLRGCIGTLSPRLFITALPEYALISSLQDRRFRPIAWSELSQLRCAVSMLIKYETCQTVFDWTVGVHGILIKFSIPPASASSNHSRQSSSTMCSSSSSSKVYSATYLPEVAKEQNWTKEQAVHSLIEKAGYHGTVSNELLSSISCTRYQSTKIRVTYEEYVQDYKNGIDPMEEKMQNHYKNNSNGKKRSLSSSPSSSSNSVWSCKQS